MQLAPIQRALKSYDGLSVGDGFGQCFFSLFHHIPIEKLGEKPLPAPPWPVTDDTIMAASVVENLVAHGAINQDALAMAFAQRFMKDPDRGYGTMAQKILVEIYSGTPWRDIAPAAFGGTGSMGNGSAMRVAPLGAYFADDPLKLTDEARKSSEVTHAHPEALAGAIAIALAAAFATNHASESSPKLIRDFLEFVFDQTPTGKTREGIARAIDLPRSSNIQNAVKLLGNGRHITCPDTVPICLWLAARHFNDYEAAMWSTVEALGDIDTNCAIVGGIVAMSSKNPIPSEWLDNRSRFPRISH